MSRFVISAIFLFTGSSHGALATPTDAQLRRYEGNDNCSGTFKVLSTDRLGECHPYVIPAPASLLVEYVNETAYASYHYQGPVDCSGTNRTLVQVLTVGDCEAKGGYSQRRVWITEPVPPPASCAVPGVCGRSYQACCLGSKVKGSPCKCQLRNGSGEAGARDCGFCGKAFVTCCTAYKLGSHPCGCDVAHGSAEATIVV